MAIPYRTKRFLRGLFTTVLVLVLVAVVITAVWILWLDRYVVYSRDGAKLDFTLNQQPVGEQAVAPQPEDPVNIFYNEGDNALNTSIELTQMAGYYIDISMLTEDPAGVLATLRQLPDQTTVLLELKDIAGRFYYNTSLGPIKTSADLDAIAQIIQYLDRSNLYAIAKVPAFRDYYYGLENVSEGLGNSKGYLWMDESRSYWLRPTSDAVIHYLTQIIKELKEMGFAEVVLGDFRFPKTDKIVFKADKGEALATAAARLMEACGSDRFALSFLVEDGDFPLPAGRSRLYMQDVAAADVAGIAAETTVADPAVGLVFLTDVNDTRFDAYSVLRPITSAQLEEEEAE